MRTAFASLRALFRSNLRQPNRLSLQLGVIALVLFCPFSNLQRAEAAPIVINTIADLQNIQLSGDYVLGSDINASGFNFTPIGGQGSFTGTLDGGGHTISSLTINDSINSFVGLFGTIDSGGVVKNLQLSGESVTATGASVGGLTGFVRSGATISNVFITGAISGGDNVALGGLVGSNFGNIMLSGSAATVVGGSATNVGGLVGISGGQVNRSFVTGNVTAGANSNIGGLVGFHAFDSNGSLVDQSFAAGQVVGGTNSRIGGLVGWNFDVTITNSYSTGNVTGTNSSYLGGLVGENGGGCFPCVPGTIGQSYSTGRVSDPLGQNVGGLIGFNQPQTGAFINPGFAANSYWDVQSSGASLGTGGNNTGVTGLTTAQLQSGSLPSGFSPSVWSATPGKYPTLTSLPPPQGAPAPPTQVELAQMSQGAELYRAGLYKGTAVDSFSVVQEGVGNGGFGYQIWQNGNQVVLAISGTYINAVKTVLADSSFLCVTPITCHVVSNDMEAQVSQAAALLASMATDPRFVGATITLTGHSLGGAIAQILGSKTFLPTQAFDAPGAKDLLPQLATALSPLDNVSFMNSNSSNMNANLRMYGDQVSVVSNALIGTQTTIASNTSQTDAHVWAAALANHDVGNMVLQLQANALQTDGITGPVSSLAIGTIEVLGAIIKIGFTVLTAGLDYVVDPVSAYKYLFTANPGSPNFLTVTLPALPGTGVVAYDIEQFSNGVWSSPFKIDPLQTFFFDPFTTEFEFWGLDGANTNIPLPTGFLFDVSFASTGEFSGRLESIGPVSEPPTWSLFLLIVVAFYLSRSNRQKHLNVLATRARRSQVRYSCSVDKRALLCTLEGIR